MTVYESMSPAERSLRARTAVHTSWANTKDRRKRGQGGVEARLRRFEQQVDPDGLLEPGERRVRAQSLMKAQMSELSRQSAKARKK